ncbi:MAG: hypothetical protein BAJALOKI1v1_1600008 [Promethearchaeota archaeon]|nr:MAG: hypothetical protein BAJALOKI1v1_1600008 [Candidatus Lokiarchaeota archaeon]
MIKFLKIIILSKIEWNIELVLILLQKMSSFKIYDTQNIDGAFYPLAYNFLCYIVNILYRRNNIN